MRNIFFTIASIGIINIPLHGQATYDLVYNIFQTNCTFSSCHDNNNPIGDLDLQSSGSSAVYSNIVGIVPTNSYASAQGYKLIYQGDPYRSFIFRKCNNGLSNDVKLDASEGTSMPQGNVLRNEEIELIRQWILYGAPKTGSVVDTSLIFDFYNNSGISSVTEVPAKPNASEGFQIHMGPYFLQKSGEIEYFLRYDLTLPSALEVNRIDVNMGTQYSHHFIIFKYQDGFENEKNDGLRSDNAHYYTSFVSALQASDSVILPGGTAFKWPQTTVLDLNSHFINYSSTKVLSCDVYVNVYTQANGIASQEMKTELGVNPNIWIPNDGTDYFFSEEYNSTSSNYLYVWLLSSHTHQWGKQYNIFKRTASGSKGEELFDGSNLEGDPNGTYIGYDYQHPPTRFFDPFLPIKWSEGFIHEATFNNTGSQSVGFGETSEDEMMIMLMMYTDDTTGVWITSQNELNSKDDFQTQLYPNPCNDYVTLYSKKIDDAVICFFNMLGQKAAEFKVQGQVTVMNTSQLNPGVYFYDIRNVKNNYGNGKLIIK